MKITDIAITHINPRLAERNVGQKAQFRGIDTQTVFKVTADSGEVGYGESRGHVTMDIEDVERLADSHPFDHINADLPVGLMGAFYDLMGKHLEIPAYKLMGQKVRDRVAVAAWTRPSSPEDLAAEVVRAAGEGYMRFKMHTCEYFDVLEQNEAVEEVAPPGFLMHYDFNHNRSSADVSSIIEHLEKSPVVGVIEDPLVWRDVDGWRRLREKTPIPLLMHVPQLGGGPEITLGCADAYMVGEHGIGMSLKRGFACAEANVSTVIQLTGGTLSKAMALHLGAVIPNVMHTVNLDDQYGEDVTGGRIEVADGSSPVPEGPGLGVEVDEAELLRIAGNPMTEIPRHIGKLILPGGNVYHTIGYPSVSRLTGFREGNIRGVRLEIWEEDGSASWQETYDWIERHGPFKRKEKASE